MQEPQVVRELKRDAFGRVELLDGPAGPCVRRVACGGRAPGSRFLAHRLLARERRALEALGDVDGVVALHREALASGYASAPSMDGTVPRAAEVLLRRWIEGEPLWAVARLPADFFERLEDLVTDVHGRGVCHNDLHKEPNVLVDAAGYPALVDFQLASVHRRRGRTFDVRVAEDLRHVEKHQLRYAARGVRRARPGGRRRSLGARVWMAAGKPLYNLVTRRLLDLEDGEPRRPSSGPWPERTPPVGPRASA